MAMDCCREPIHKHILGVYVTRLGNIIISESFLSSFIKSYDKHICYSHKGTIWYLEAFISLGLNHILHSLCEKSMAKGTIEYIIERTEAFDDFTIHM